SRSASMRIYAHSSTACPRLFALGRLFRQIVLLGVLAHHAHGGELGHEGDHGPADPLDPLPREALLVALVKKRNDLVGQGFVKAGAVLAVLLLDRVGMRIFADRKTVGAVVALPPPAVEDAEVEAAMSAGFHAAGAGGLQRTARGVEPDVAAGHHLPGDVHVVVLDEDEVSLEIAVFAEVDDVLDVTLAVVVARMGLAGENELDGPGLVASQLHDVVELLEDQRSAFIGGETAGEADGQRVGIEQLIESDEVALGQALALDEQAAAG